MREMRTQAHRDLLALLRETKAVHAESPTEGRPFENMKAMFKKDARYTRLDCLERERDAYIIDYITTQAPKKESRDIAALVAAEN